MSNMGQRTPTETLSHRLRLMADAGGVLTRDRKRVCIEAADRLTEQDEMCLGISATCRELAHENNQLRRRLGFELRPEVNTDEEH